MGHRFEQSTKKSRMAKSVRAARPALHAYFIIAILGAFYSISRAAVVLPVLEELFMIPA
jgi:hypothetical protein